MRLSRLLARIAALLPLAACEDYGRVTQTVVDPTYRPEELAYASGDRNDQGIFVQVSGGVRGMDEQSLTTQVLAALSQAAQGKGARFTTVPQSGERGIYRIAWIFNPATTLVDAELCAGRLPPSEPAASDITVRAALCRGGKPLAGALGTMDVDDAREADRFDRFLRDVAATILPDRTPS